MASVLNRQTKQFIRSVNTPDFDPTEWLINPDLSAVSDVEKKYWKIGKNSVSEMTEQEKAAVDLDLEAEKARDLKAALKARFDQEDDNTKAVLLLVLDMYDIIRSEVRSLPSISRSQLKARFESIVDSL